MLDLYAELRRIVEALDAAGIAYALAGGLAVSIYTTPRATEDIDILIARADLDRVVRTLQPTGFRPAGRPMQVAAGPALTRLIADRASLTLEGHRVWVIGLASLRTLKRLRGSALDRADLEALGPE